MLCASASRESARASYETSTSLEFSAWRTAVALAKSDTGVYAPAGRTARVISSLVTGSMSRIAERSGVRMFCRRSSTRSRRPCRSVNAIARHGDARVQARQARLVEHDVRLIRSTDCFGVAPAELDRRYG